MKIRTVALAILVSTALGCTFVGRQLGSHDFDFNREGIPFLIDLNVTGICNCPMPDQVRDQKLLYKGRLLRSGAGWALECRSQTNRIHFGSCSITVTDPYNLLQEYGNEKSIYPVYLNVASNKARCIPPHCSNPNGFDSDLKGETLMRLISIPHNG